MFLIISKFWGSFVNLYIKDLGKMFMHGLSIILIWSKKSNKESNIYHALTSLILLIVESDASNLGHWGILKQEYNNQVHIVRYH